MDRRREQSAKDSIPSYHCLCHLLFVPILVFHSCIGMSSEVSVCVFCQALHVSILLSVLLSTLSPSPIPSSHSYLKCSLNFSLSVNEVILESTMERNLCCTFRFCAVFAFTWFKFSSFKIAFLKVQQQIQQYLYFKRPIL